MKQIFVKSWKKSKQPRKQRKYQAHAPLHIKQKFMGAPLSKDLQKKYKIKTIGVRKDDKVKIMRGQFRKQTGKVVAVLLKRSRMFVEGAQRVKRDGTKVFYPLHPSNVQIIEMVTTDKERMKRAEQGKEKK